jgi:hypothetical protein
MKREKRGRKSFFIFGGEEPIRGGRRELFTRRQIFSPFR